MLIDLSRIRGEPFHWQESKTFPPDCLEREELQELSAVEWRGRLVWAESGYYLTAHLEYRQTLVCNRCLASFTEPVSADVELLLQVEERPPEASRADPPREAPEELELEEEELGLVTVLGDRFDTDPILLEQLQLNIPMKPLCRRDCRGLCPTCGADLNREECSCREEVVDPRWAALAGLKDRLEK